MTRLSISETGKHSDNRVWHIEQWQDVGEPSIYAERHGRKLEITFETHRERERFIAGIEMCRAIYMDGDITREIFLSKK